MHRETCLYVCAVLVTALATPAWAKTVTVVPGGAGETPIADAVGTLEDGDKLVLKKGIYSETLEIRNLTDITVSAKKGAEIVDAAREGVKIINSTNITVTGLTIRNPGDNGIEITFASEVTIKKCTVELDTSTGISVDSSTSDVTITKCTTVGGDEGIYIEDVSPLLLSKNDCFDSTGDGIFVTISLPAAKETDCTITKNLVEGSGGNGITIEGNDLVVEKNDVADVDGWGISAGDGAPIAGTLVRKNDIESAALGGIGAFHENAFFEKNTVKDCGADSIRVIGEMTTLVKNTVKNAAQSAFYISGDSSTVERNTAKGGAGNYGFRLVANSLIVTKNTAKDATENGFHLVGSGCTFTKNTAKKNGEPDFKSLEPKSANTYDGNKFTTEEYDDE